MCVCLRVRAVHPPACLSKCGAPSPCACLQKNPAAALLKYPDEKRKALEEMAQSRLLKALREAGKEHCLALSPPRSLYARRRPRVRVVPCSSDAYHADKYLCVCVCVCVCVCL